MRLAEQLVSLLKTDTPPILVMNQVAMMLMASTAYGSVHGVSPFEALGNRIALHHRRLQGFCVECEGEPNPCLLGALRCASCEASGAIESMRLRPDFE